MSAQLKEAILSTQKSFQSYYPEHLAHCYGCGHLNEFGHHLESYWDDDETIAWFTPESYHIAIPGYVYGGLIASLVDCHGTGSAAAFAYRAARREMGDNGPPLRFLTASLHVNYLRPTPLGVELVLRGKAAQIAERKVVVDIQVMAREQVCATGQVVAVLVPDQYITDLLVN